MPQRLPEVAETLAPRRRRPKGRPQLRIPRLSGSQPSGSLDFFFLKLFEGFPFNLLKVKLWAGDLGQPRKGPCPFFWVARFGMCDGLLLRTSALRQVVKDSAHCGLATFCKGFTSRTHAFAHTIYLHIKCICMYAYVCSHMETRTESEMCLLSCPLSAFGRRARSAQIRGIWPGGVLQICHIDRVGSSFPTVWTRCCFWRLLLWAFWTLYSLWTI